VGWGRKDPLEPKSVYGMFVSNVDDCTWDAQAPLPIPWKSRILSSCCATPFNHNCGVITTIIDTFLVGSCVLYAAMGLRVWTSALTADWPLTHTWCVGGSSPNAAIPPIVALEIAPYHSQEWQQLRANVSIYM